MKKKLLALFFVLLMAAVGVLQYKYDSHRGYLSARQVFVTLPPGSTLKILSWFPEPGGRYVVYLVHSILLLLSSNQLLPVY